MGINQAVYVWYGWYIKLTPEMREWQESIDYDLPAGFLNVDPIGDKCTMVFGVQLFNSGCSRWEPMEGFVEYTHEYARSRLLNFYENTDLDMFQDHIRKNQARYFNFVNNT